MSILVVYNQFQEILQENTQELFYPENRQAWREWLVENHQTAKNIWLLFYKKGCEKPSITWTEAVEEALCFGWIDSKKNTIDDISYKQFFCPRKPNSTWSKINKEKVAEFTKAGLMTPAGLATIKTAKKNGSWTILDSVEALIIPKDLELAFAQHHNSKDFFLSLSKSVKKGVLYFVISAKQKATREKRVAEVAECAANQQLPKSLRP